MPVEQQKLLQVAVVGVPNAGKSSMVNALVGSKVRALQNEAGPIVYLRVYERSCMLPFQAQLMCPVF